ncbi:hypothetical protein SS50377_23393 [Spironucleus salmonicida]|uniref:Uncharacterized protein n=1 Tax=Spironucleus salmonicida TaxID=348837 RepID=V6M232_9EUKA|nr:hypothetical protein SS50377_23393 [Spironucleus salmonicida]|eukprot:EST47264.1 Hypothetical protein SS50377_12774 [Spironucleus salmonicida]
MSSRTIFLHQKTTQNAFHFKESEFDALSFASLSPETQLDALQQLAAQKSRFLQMIAAINFAEIGIFHAPKFAFFLNFAVSHYHFAPSETHFQFNIYALQSAQIAPVELAISLLNKSAVRLSGCAQNAAVRILSDRFEWSAVRLIFLAMELEMCVLPPQITAAVLLKLAKSRHWFRGLDRLDSCGVGAGEYLEAAIMSGNDVSEVLESNYCGLQDIELGVLRQMQAV